MPFTWKQTDGAGRRAPFCNHPASHASPNQSAVCSWAAVLRHCNELRLDDANLHFVGLVKHLRHVRKECSENRNLPQCFAVELDMVNPILCNLGVMIPSTHIDKAGDMLLGVLYAFTRATNRCAAKERSFNAAFRPDLERAV